MMRPYGVNGGAGRRPSELRQAIPDLHTGCVLDLDSSNGAATGGEGSGRGGGISLAATRSLHEGRIVEVGAGRSTLP